MANLRPALMVTLAFLGYLLWVEWQKDYGPAPRATATETGVTPGAQPGADVPDAASAVADLPSAEAIPGVTTEPGLQAAPIREQRVTVETDVLSLEIDPVGGTVVSAQLLDYPVDLEAPDTKVQLFKRAGDELFIAQSGLLSAQSAPDHTKRYDIDSDRYELGGAERLEIPFRWTDPDSGISVTKTFVLERGSYEIAVQHTVRNDSAANWVGSHYLQLQQSVPLDEDSAGFNNPERYSFRGIGVYSPAEKLEKIDFDDVIDSPFQATTIGGWLAMIQHHFFAAWIPAADETLTYTTQQISGRGWPRYLVRGVAQPVTLPAGGQVTIENLLYVGPKLQDHLEDIAPGLDLTVNYGIFTVFSAPLFWLLDKIHGFVGNWGWAIVLLTVLIKLAFFKLTEAQYRSMARMRKLQPRIEKLKERYGDDRQAMSQAMMTMYKEEKVNPLGGCLPILVQIPIFIALYWVLLESVELRQAPFILWIDNLSKPDPYFILPILNAAFMIMTQRLTPMVGMDPMQRKMMQAMPVVFSVMFAFFPAGLVLYWATNAGLSLAQQWYITQKIAGDS